MYEQCLVADNPNQDEGCPYTTTIVHKHISFSADQDRAFLAVRVSTMVILEHFAFKYKPIRLGPSCSLQMSMKLSEGMCRSLKISRSQILVSESNSSSHINSLGISRAILFKTVSG